MIRERHRSYSSAAGALDNGWLALRFRDAALFDDPSETDKAMQIWKTECAPLMIQQKGCISEKLLRCKDAHEFISYSEWETEADIDAYRNSDAHREIVRHARGLKGSNAEVKLYELVN